MATFTVLRFPTADGAEATLTTLERFQKGTAVGAATGALTGSLTGAGIDGGFIKEVGER